MPLSGSALAVCPDPAALVDEVEQAVLDGRFEQAHQVTDRVEAAFGCTGSADSHLLARLWIAEGAAAHVEGDSATRDQAFASAWRLAPGTWTVAFGEELRTAWMAAVHFDPGSGQLDVEGLTEGQIVRVDGRPVDVPTQLASGLYLVQADDDGAPPAFARIILVPGDQTLVVRIDQQVFDDAVGSTSLDTRAVVSPPPGHRGRWAWFVGAGAAGALAGTSAVLADRAASRMDDTDSIDDLDRALTQQRSYAVASYGLAGLGAVCVGIGLVW